MTANIQVYNLATREKLQDLSNTSIVDLSTSSVVKVDLYKEDIKQYVREGNNLVLVLNSGEKSSSKISSYNLMINHNHNWFY